MSIDNTEALAGVAKTLYDALLAVYQDIDLVEVEGGSISLDITVSEALKLANPNDDTDVIGRRYFYVGEMLDQHLRGQTLREALVYITADTIDIPEEYLYDWSGDVSVTDEGFTVTIRKGRK